MSILKEKAVDNKVCGTAGCNMPATTRVKFVLGFSAGFCKRCAEELIQNGISIKETVEDDL